MKARRKFTRDFKLSVLRELEGGKSAAQVCRENEVHQAMLSKWKREYGDNPQEAFKGSGNVCKLEAQIAQQERLIGQLYMENKLLKKAMSVLEIRAAEQRKRTEPGCHI